MSRKAPAGKSLPARTESWLARIAWSPAGNIETMRTAIRVRRILAGAGLAGWLLFAIGPAWRLVSRNLAFGAAHMTDSLEAARTHVRGPEFVHGIDAIARVIPEDATYWLLEGRAGSHDSYWVRACLAPRKARYLGPREAPDPAGVALIQSSSPPPFVVEAWSSTNGPMLIDPRTLEDSAGLP